MADALQIAAYPARAAHRQQPGGIVSYRNALPRPSDQHGRTVRPPSHIRRGDTQLPGDLHGRRGAAQFLTAGVDSAQSHVEHCRLGMRREPVRQRILIRGQRIEQGVGIRPLRITLDNIGTVAFVTRDRRMVGRIKGPDTSHITVAGFFDDFHFNQGNSCIPGRRMKYDFIDAYR